MIKTYAIGIEFIGTHYRGWQRQAHDSKTIQAHLEYAISRVANETVEVIAAGRTDSGVHASNMIAHFCTHAKRSTHSWLCGVNSLLPNDIALRWLVDMPTDFHARFMATSRRYRYITLNQPQRPAILYRQITHQRIPLDVDAMIEACQYIVGTHDFTSFRATSCQSNRPVRHIHHANLFMHGQFLVFDIQADGFLHHMVRNLMGALFAIGENKLAVDGIQQLINAKDRRLAPPTASADGLYFINAYYPAVYQSLLPNLPLTPNWLTLAD